MPRRRSLSPEFFKDEDLAHLPFEARLLFQGLWCYADRAGRLEDRPKYLKAELFAYDRINIDTLLTLLANPNIPDRPAKAFIRRYVVDNRQYIEIIEFVKHQKPHPHESASQYPEPIVTCNYEPLHVTASNDTSTLHMTNDQGPVKGPKTKDQKDKEPKKAYGELQNVKLTDHELTKLETRFGKDDARRRIENLSQYIDSKGDKYKGHYGTILQWAAKDDKSKPVTPPPPPSTDPTYEDLLRQAEEGPQAHEMCMHAWLLTPELRAKYGDRPEQTCIKCDRAAEAAAEKGARHE